MAHLLEGLRSPNEISQSVAVSDLSELFLLGNEETLPNVPVREIIQALILLLQKDHNFELMLTAARCLTNMQEALPRSHPVIVEAVPILLQKLKRIEYIDVAEQSLTILEVMSRRNARNILTAGGIADTISNVDFFPLPSQRLIFQIASNCAAYIGNAEFGLIKDCLSDLTLRFGFVEDKRCVESICTFFNRIIDNLRNYPDRLREIAGQNHEFLKNVQSMIMNQSPIVGTNILLNLLRSCRYMGAKCGDLAVSMIKMDFGRSIRYLLIGAEKSEGNETVTVDVNTRPAQYILEIIELIGEMMPCIPNSEAYELSKLLHFYSGMNTGAANYLSSNYTQTFQRFLEPVVSTVNWYYMDEISNTWQIFSSADATMLDNARSLGEQFFILEMNGETYEFDFARMIRRNINTGSESVVDRRFRSTAQSHISLQTTSNKSPETSTSNLAEIDEREKLKKEQNESYVEVIGMLFPLLVDIGTATTCSNLRFEILRVMMRMINAVESEVNLRKILSDVPLAIYISSTLSTSKKNYTVLVSALELVGILLEKIPTLYAPLLESEGVFYAINKLVQTEAKKAISSSDLKTAIQAVSVPNIVSQDIPSSSVGTSSNSNIIVNSGNNAQSTSSNSFSLSAVNSSNPAVNQQPGNRTSSMSLSSYLAVAAAAAAHFNLNQNNDISNSMAGSLTSTARLRPFAYQTTTRQLPAAIQANYAAAMQGLAILPESASTSIPFNSSTLSSQVSSNPLSLEQFTYALSPHYRPAASLEQQLLQFSSSMSDANYLNSTNSLPTSSALQYQAISTSASAMAAALSQLQPQYLNSLNFVSPSSPSINNNLIPTPDMLMPLSTSATQSLPNLTINPNLIYPNTGSIANPVANSSSTFTVRDGYASALNDPSLSGNFSYPFDSLAAPNAMSASSIGSLSTNTSNSQLPSNSVLTRNAPPSANINTLSTFMANSATSSSNVRNLIMERLQEFVSTEAQRIVSKFPNEKNSPKTSVNVMSKMKKLTKQFSTKNKDLGVEPLKDLKKLLIEHEISVFHFTHSGIDTALTTYLTDLSNEFLPTRTLRLQRFADVFMSINSKNLQPPINEQRKELSALERLITKVIHSIGQLEQFTVKLTNLSGIGQASGSSTTYLRGAQAMRFFQSHQIRLHLQRHPACRQLREWRHGRGSIKVDPFASVSSIERYLLERGVFRSSNQSSGGGEDSSDNDDASDEDQIELNDSIEQQTEGGAETQRRNALSSVQNDRIELYMGSNKLASDLSVLQAIRQYSYPHDDESQETIPASMWMTAHQILYRAAVSTPTTSNAPSTSAAGALPTGGLEQASDLANNSVSTAPTNLLGETSVSTPSTSSNVPNLRRRDHKGQSASQSRSSINKESPDRKVPRVGGVQAKNIKKFSTSITKGHPLFKDGVLPKRLNALDEYLDVRTVLPAPISNDASIGCLVLLKALYGLNTYWWTLFDEDENVIIPSYASILPSSIFHSSKLTSKVSRQLSDFLSVAIQQIPKWTLDLVKSFPFVFPFVTRRNFFYCTTFGRDRALMYLVNEGSGDIHDSNDSTSRLMPRLERRKISVNRNNLLKDAQHCLAQLGSSKAMLEVIFEGEAGTGFGPTLEFYSTVSKEIQKHSLKMWHGKPEKNEDDASEDNIYTVAENGVYPALYRPPTCKQMETRLKKFEFFGRLIAQALMDSRMLDVPMSPLFLKWLTGREETLGLNDFEVIEPQMYHHMQSLSTLSPEEISELDTYFMFPGENSFELIKGGKNMELKKDNLKKYVELVFFWRVVEGVRAEMEAIRRGFRLVINTDSLKIFFPDEIEQLFCGSTEKNDEKVWAKATMQQALRPDHGFTHDSIQITYLVDMLHSFSNEKRRKFLQFVTGSPRLPFGGFLALNPPLTVVRKTANSEFELPSAMTCYNYLKIPPYHNYETFVERFEVALHFTYSFHLT